MAQITEIPELRTPVLHYVHLQCYESRADPLSHIPQRQKVFSLAQRVESFASPGRVTQVPQKVW